MTPENPTAPENPMTPENPKSPLHKNPWLWAFLIGIVLVTLTRPLLRRIPEPPPVLGHLPEFGLVDAGGNGLGPADLEGSVWVLAFFSTSGDSACGGLIESMSELGRRYDEAGVAEVRLLGIGTEPEAAGSTGATGSALIREFGEAQGLAPPRWFLASGDPRERSRLADALLAATGEPPGSRGFQGGVPRPCRLFLVDGSGGIRGSYRDDTMGLDELFHRARHVARAMGL